MKVVVGSRTTPKSHLSNFVWVIEGQSNYLIV